MASYFTGLIDSVGLVILGYYKKIPPNDFLLSEFLNAPFIKSIEFS